MAAVAVLGAGPHGHQIAHDLRSTRLYDDLLDGYRPCLHGAQHNRWVVGAVWPAVRRQIVDKLAGATILDPYKDGVVVAPSAVIGIDVGFGEHVHVLANATVAHGCRVGTYSTIATGAILCGEVTVGDDVFIGAGTVIVHGGITIGHGAFVNAGAVVKTDVLPGEHVR